MAQPAKNGRGAGLVILWVAVSVVLLTIGINTNRVLQAPFDYLAVSDNDSLMRLMSVRAWLDGQSWYDMTNYRVLPPEGISLHWSRYVDLAIGGLISAFALAMPMETAEIGVGLLWPTLILLGFVAVTGYAGLRLYGPVASAIAMLAIVVWRPITTDYMGAFRFDHHNLQILLMTLLIVTLLLPGRPFRTGLLGGAAAALSLAIGLESLIPIALAGIILLVRTLYGQPAARGQLIGFGGALAGFALPLYLGQTPPSQWLTTSCDALGPQVLGLAFAGGALSAAAALLAPRLSTFGARSLALVGAAAVAGAVAVPIYLSCAGGPYGNLSEDLRQVISTRIMEAQPFLTVAFERPATFFTTLLPAAAAMIVASLVFVFTWINRRHSAPHAGATAMLLIFGWVALLGMAVQVRMVVIAAPVVPLLIGYAVGELSRLRKANQSAPGFSLALILAAFVTLMPPFLHQLYLERQIAEAQVSDTPPRHTSARCERAEIMRSLNTLPQGRILTTDNLSPPILVFTDHDVLGALYHRSAEALHNGIVALDGDDGTNLFRALTESRGDYVVLCRDARLAESSAFVAGLARGEPAAGLQEIENVHPALVVLRYDGS